MLLVHEEYVIHPFLKVAGACPSGRASGAWVGAGAPWGVESGRTTWSGMKGSPSEPEVATAATPLRT